MRSSVTRTLCAVVGILVLALTGSATARAAVLAVADVSAGVSTATWSVVATGQGGSASNSTTRVSINRDGNDRWGFFDAVNNGSTTVSGFTLSFSGFPSQVSGLTVHACVGGSWTRVGRGNYTCSGTASNLGSTSRNSSFGAGVGVPAGGRVAFRLVISGNQANSGTGTVGASVSRSQAPAASVR